MDNYSKIGKNSYAGTNNTGSKVTNNSGMDNSGKQITKIGNSYGKD